MSPGDERSRPSHGTATQTSLTDQPSLQDLGLVELEPRAGGVVRAVMRRTIKAECTACEMTFTSTGTAASHARASRHTVVIDYSASFAFVPSKTGGGEVIA
jgi:hypothetical protein